MARVIADSKQLFRQGAAAALQTLPSSAAAAPQRSMPVRESKYRELALQAVALVESDTAHRDTGRLRNKDNMALHFFLRSAYVRMMLAM